MSQVRMEHAFDKLIQEGGCIVSSADCHEAEISDAMARGDFFQDAQGFGFVRRLPAWMQRHCRFHRGSVVDMVGGHDSGSHLSVQHGMEKHGVDDAETTKLTQKDRPDHDA